MITIIKRRNDQDGRMQDLVRCRALVCKTEETIKWGGLHAANGQEGNEETGGCTRQISPTFLHLVLQFCHRPCKSYASFLTIPPTSDPLCAKSSCIREQFSFFCGQQSLVLGTYEWYINARYWQKMVLLFIFKAKLVNLLPKYIMLLCTLTTLGNLVHSILRWKENIQKIQKIANSSSCVHLPVIIINVCFYIKGFGLIKLEDFTNTKYIPFHTIYNFLFFKRLVHTITKQSWMI